jgi:hypothetical protein
MKKYLPITFTYKDIGGNTCINTMFVPISFIENGDLQDWTLKPDCFLGVDLKAVLNIIDSKELV